MASQPMILDRPRPLDRRYSHAYTFKGDLLPTKNNIRDLTRTTDGKEKLGVWCALARVAQDAMPRGWLLDEELRPVTSVSISHLAWAKSELVERVLDEMVRMGALELRPFHRVVSLAGFVLQMCITGDHVWASSAQLRSQYVEWCTLTQQVPLSLKLFRESLQKDFRFEVANSRRVDGRRLRTFEGVGLMFEQEKASLGECK